MIALTALVLAACNVATSSEVEFASATSNSAATADLPLASVQVDPTVTSGVVGTVLQPTRVATTGILEVDRAVAVILSNDVAARRDLIHYTTAGCTHELGMGGPPKCEPGQAEGTLIEYFPVLGPGEGEHILRDSIDRMLEFDARALYAVYRRTDHSVIDQYFPSGIYGLVVITGRQEDAPALAQVHLSADGKVVRIDYLAWPPQSILQQESKEWLVTPLQTPFPQPDRKDGAPTRTPFPGEGPGQILSFIATSENERPGPGDDVVLHWRTVGGPASICVSYGGQSKLECFDVPPSGQHTYTLPTENPVADHWADFLLHVRDSYSGDFESVRLPVECQTEWFRDVQSQWCPQGSADNSIVEAIYQAFEGGIVVQQGNFARVIFDEPGDPCRHFNIGQQLEIDTNLPEPPSGRYLPGQAFAVLWQGELSGTEDLQERLGWGISPPESYLMIFQCENTPDGLGSCYATVPDGRVFSPEGIPGETNIGGISYDDGTCRWITTDVDPGMLTISDSLQVAFIAEEGIQLWSSQKSAIETLVAVDNVTGLEFSHDGQQIAFTRKNESGRTSLWVVDVENSQARQLLSPEDLLALNLSESKSYSVSPHHMTWIPRTYQIAFSTLTSPLDGMADVFQELRVIDADSGEHRLLLSDEQGGTFKYSPDGAHIVLVSDSGVSLLLADGSVIVRDIVTYEPLEVMDGFHHPVASWHRDAKSFIFGVSQTDDGMEALANPNVVSTLWQVALDGSATELATITGLALDAQYSSDLTKVGFTHDSASDNQVREVHVARTDGTRDDLYAIGGFHSWQPAGDGFLFYSGEGQPYIGQLDHEPVAFPFTSYGNNQLIWIRWVDDRMYLYSLGDGRLLLGDLDGRGLQIGQLASDSITSARTFDGVDFHLGY